MAKFTAGPAMATAISWRGASGMASARATPPIGNSTMSRTRIPYRLICKQCPNSCSTTQANTDSTSTAARTPSCQVPVAAATEA